MPENNTKFSWLGTIGLILSVFACYGTLLIIGILGVMGATIIINETIWAGAIIAFALLAVAGLAIGRATHHRSTPVLTGILGAIVLIYTMYVNYDRLTEISGFLLLSVATYLDFRLRRSCPTSD